MHRKVRIILFSIFVSTIFLTFFSIQIYRDSFFPADQLNPVPVKLTGLNEKKAYYYPNFAIGAEEHQERFNNHRLIQRVSSSDDDVVLESVSVLLPDWIVLVIVSPSSSEYNSLEMNSGYIYSCVFQNKSSSPARFSGVLPFTNQITFKCVLPYVIRRRLPFLMPVLTRSREITPEINYPAPIMMRWSFLVYDSFSTENDVVVFAKGVNNRQGINRSPETLQCLFGDDITTAVKTDVTSSSQEVFRCPHPITSPENLDGYGRSKISLEITTDENRKILVPSVAYYTPRPTVVMQQQKSLICACTMVYNVAKFLKEWVMYHSKIGVEKFILYDNDSDDDLNKVVEDLVKDGYDVKTMFWLWPKTQEAGFSHSVLYAEESCTWMMYIDVDEFVYSPSWRNLNTPSNGLLKSFLTENDRTGQVSFHCNEFGPSNQLSNPISGVTQGYTCRRRIEQRHKSIVLLDAIDPTLANAVHHFGLRDGYKWKRVDLEDGIVNHYKYQAWPEFKAKFRRRVSAYVVDWTQAVNPTSKDRTPGLGFSPVEPEGWAEKFCEVRDNRLKWLTRKWFGSSSPPSEFHLAWQR